MTLHAADHGGSPTPDPTVMAVVVAHDPGEWFTETLESLANQHYTHLRATVVDCSGVDLTERVRATIGNATVIRAPAAKGFSAAANAVLSTGLDTKYALICHDDVALEPDAVSRLVAEAETSQGAHGVVVGPKLVGWDRPDLIQHVGLEVDRFGVAYDIAGDDELDQEQYDDSRAVFAVNSAVMLISSELFARLGGFDPALALKGEDVDLCWRAQLAGARVSVAGSAKARHREMLDARGGRARSGRARGAQGGSLGVAGSAVRGSGFEGIGHSVRAMLVNHGRISLGVFVPLALAMSAIEVLLSLFTARLGRARAVAWGWLWNLARFGDVPARRRANARIRVRRPADVTARQYLGSVRALSFVRRRFGGSEGGGAGGIIAGANRGLLGSLNVGAARTAWVAWAVVVAVVLFGSRSLITSGVPAVGDFVPFGDNAAEMIERWWSGWSLREGGAPTSNTPGLVWLGIAGVVLERVGGSLELLRTIWVIAPLFVGLIGAYRLMAPTRSRRAQVCAVGAYMVIPLGWASLAGGSIAGLVGYAVAPWLLAGGLRALGAPPFAERDRDRLPRVVQAAMAIGVAAGLAAMFEPVAGLLVLPVVAGLAVGSLVAGRPAGVLRLVGAVVLAAPVVAVLCFSVVVDALASGPDPAVLAGGRDGSGGATSLSELLRFAVGPDDPGPYLWLIFLPMLLPLLMGRGWRLEVAIRLWMTAATAWMLALLAETGQLGFGLGDVELLIAPAAAAGCGLFAMAVVTVEHDLRLSRFGWRHALVPVAAVAAILAAAASISHLDEGRWGLHRSSHFDLLEFEPEVLSGAYRVLWVGAPEFLPVQPRALGPSVSWAATSGEQVTLADRAVTFDPGSSELVATLLGDIANGETSRAGRQLAGLGVRYVVLEHRLTPAPFSSEEAARPVPAALRDGLRSQLDMELREGTNSAFDVFVNTAWAPMRAVHPPGFDSGAASLGDLETLPLGQGAAVFSGAGPPWSATVPAGSEVLVAQTPRPGWELTVDGEAAPRREALGWARAYQIDSGGEAVLAYQPGWWRRAGQILTVAAPLLLGAAWLRRRLGWV